MAELLLINPRRRKARAPAKRRRTASPAQKRARAAFAAASRARAGRRSNPVRRRRASPVVAATRRRRARRARNTVKGYYPNPARRAMRRMSRRRRNPIGLGNASSYLSMLKEGFIGGAGAIAVDLTYGYLAPYLPTSLQRTPGQASVGDAVKAVVTIAMGKLLSRPTRGLSEKAARGALVVQAHGLIAQMLPGTMTLGYATPAGVISNMSTRIGPNRAALGRYTTAGATQMLGRYTQPYATQMLASRGQVMSRETGSAR